MFSGMWDLLDMDLENFEEDNMEDFDEEDVLTYVADKEDELILDEEKIILLQGLLCEGGGGEWVRVKKKNYYYGNRHW